MSSKCENDPSDVAESMESEEDENETIPETPQYTVVKRKLKRTPKTKKQTQKPSTSFDIEHEAQSSPKSKDLDQDSKAIPKSLGYTVIKVDSKSSKAKSTKSPTKGKQIRKRHTSPKIKNEPHSSTKEDTQDVTMSDIDSEEDTSKTNTTNLGYTVVKVKPTNSKAKAKNVPIKRKIITKAYTSSKIKHEIHSSSKEDTQDDLSDMDSEEGASKSNPISLGYTIVEVDPTSSTAKAKNVPIKRKIIRKTYTSSKIKHETHSSSKEDTKDEVSDMDSEEGPSKSNPTDLGYRIVEVEPTGSKATAKNAPIKRKKITKAYTSSKIKHETHSSPKQDTKDDVSDMDSEEGANKSNPTDLGYRIVEVEPTGSKATAKNAPIKRKKITKAYTSSKIKHETHSNLKEDTKDEVSDMDSEEGPSKSNPTHLGYTIVEVEPTGSKATAKKAPIKRKKITKPSTSPKIKHETDLNPKEDTKDDASDMDSEEIIPTGLGYTIVKVEPTSSKAKSPQKHSGLSKITHEAHSSTKDSKDVSNEYNDGGISDKDSEEGDNKTTPKALNYTILKIEPKSSKAKPTKMPKKKNQPQKQLSTSKIKQEAHSNTKDKPSSSLEYNMDDDWDNDDMDEESGLNLPDDDIHDYIDKFGVEETKIDSFQLSTPHINIQYVTIDEICLEGLDGITLEALWTRISITIKQPLPFPEYINRYLWNIITSRKDIEFYILQEPRDKFIPYDRYLNSEPDLGAALDPIETPVDIYPYEPVKEKDVLGSASSYATRELLTDEIRKLTLHEAESQYGSRLIMVGTQKMRSKALTMSLADPNVELGAAQYCLLERIGRSRTLGEITQGKVSLQTISKDPKIIFYNRKILIENKLITKQSFFMKTNLVHHTTGSLLHLTRFYNEKKSKTQIMTEQIVEVLRKKPFNRMEHSEAKRVFGRPNTLKKLFKFQEFQKFIRTDVQRLYRELHPNASVRQWKQKATDREKRIRTIELIKPDVNVAGSWNEDEVKEESSDDEDTKQMIYNSPILHQVYNYIRSGGPDGKSLKEIQSNKGMDFYSVRAAVNRLLSFNLVVGVKIDLGRQRLMKYQTLDLREPEEKPCNQASIQADQELENDAIDFLSELLEVEPEFLKPSEIIEITDETNVGDSSFELIKRLRHENKPTKDKNLGYTSKGGESLHSQLLTQKEKLKFETTSEFVEDSVVVAESVDDEGVDSSQRDLNAKALEKIFKNRHKYESAVNKLNLSLKESAENHDLMEICREICTNASNRKIKRKKKIRKRLYSKIKQISAREEEPSIENIVCPLKLSSIDNRYHKLCYKVLKVVQPILMHFKYKLNVLVPKKSYMCRQKMTNEKILKFSFDHPLLSTDLTSLDTSIIDRFNLTESNMLKRKAEADEIENLKKMRLDETVIINDALTVSTFMGPKPRIEYHAIDEDHIEITVYVSTAPEDYIESSGNKYIKDNNATLRTLKRASYIVEAVRQEKIITDIRRLHKMIESNDNEEGYNVKVDRKSIDRIYTRLVRSGHIKIVQIILKSSETRRSITIVCDPSVDIKHTVMESVIEQMKMRFFVAAMKKDWDITQTKSVPVQEKPVTAFDTNEITISVGELKLLSINDSPYLYNRNIGKTYGYAPKFMRTRLLHEFLFYLIYNYTTEEVGDVQEILSDVNVEEDLLQEMPRVYNKEVGWKMFVPPLPKHGGWQQGWALVCDVLLRLPLSLFVKLYNVSFVIPELPGYLEHPIKQHYLVKHLPSDIRNGLLHRRKYIFSIHESFARLCYIGILQFGPQKLREKDQLFIFLNRRGTLLDTTTSNAGYHYVEDKEYKKIDYYFKTSKDVETYWYEMWNICAHSKLGLRNTVTGTYITIEQIDAKPVMVEAMKSKNPESALRDDDGHVPGDRRGAGGLDSALWAHIKRNWMWCSHIKKSYDKPNSTRPGFTTIIKNTPKGKKQIKKKVEFKKVSGTNKSANLLPVTESHRRTYKNTNITPAKKSQGGGQTRQGKFVVRKVLPRVDMKKKKDYDSIDKELMAHLKQSRSEWKEDEDRILHICKIVATFLCPTQRKHCIPYTVIRDVLHKLSPCSLNKTSGACQRRLLVIFGQSDQQDFLIQIVKTLRLIPFVKKYFHKYYDEGGMSRSVTEKQAYSIFVLLVTHFVKHQNEINHIFDAIAYRYQLEPSYKTKPIPNKDEFTSFSRSVDLEPIKKRESSFDVDSNMEVLSYDYAEVIDDKVKQNKLYNETSEFPKTETDVILDTIKSIIHSTIGSRQEDISWIYQLFRVYQNYSDDLLKTALSEIRNSQMVSIKRAYTRRHSEVEGLPITTKLFQFSFYYCFAQITKFPPELFVEAHEILLGVAKHHPELTDSSKKGLPMECFEQGHAVGLAEISININTYFNIDIPKEVLLLNPKIADHTELIRELATRYKNMLTLVKQGTYFKDDDENSEFSHNTELDQVDSTKLEKAKTIPRTPIMIQRFLKSWFLADEPTEFDEDIDDNDSAKEDLNPNNSELKKLEEIERKPTSKLEKRRKYPNLITSEESKKILESLNPNLYPEKQEIKVMEKINNTKKKPDFPDPFGGNDLSFEEYEKKLESLLGKTQIDEASEVVPENLKDFEDTETDSVFGLADFSENDTNILEKYLHSKRHSISKIPISQDLVDFGKAATEIQSIEPERTEKITENPDTDPVTNARIQYLMNDELTVEQIMEQMLVDCPPEERKVPKPINLARLLVKGLFPELDEDEERLERLHQHFVIICPDTNLMVADIDGSEEFHYLYMQHGQTCKSLLRKVQMDIIISDHFSPNSEMISKLKILNATITDIHIAEELVDFVLKKRVLGASTKQLKEHFSKSFETLKLSTILNTLVSTNVLIRTGINYILYVHHKYRKHWLVESCTLADQDKLKLKEETNAEESSDIPSLARSFESYTEMKLRIMPWARIDGTVNLKVFEKWMCTVLGYCLSDTLTPLMDIIRSCCYLKPVDLYYIVECLQELGCVRMVVYNSEKTTLFSSPKYVESVPAEVTDEFGDIYIESDSFAVIKLGTLLNKKMKEFDFPADEAKKHGTF